MNDSARGPSTGDPLPLAGIQPVVFSEVMRACDLFTAVASIAADPVSPDVAPTMVMSLITVTFGQPALAAASTADSSPSSTTMADSAPSSPKRFVPTYLVARNFSNASAALSRSSTRR